MKDSLDLTSPEYWAKALEAPEVYGFNAMQAQHLADWATKPRENQNDSTPEQETEAKADFHQGFYGEEHVRTWSEMSAVSPQNAALLIHSKNPSKYKGTLPDFGQEFDLMKLVFEDIAHDGCVRKLQGWLILARERKLHGPGIEGWEACVKVLTKNSPQKAIAESKNIALPLSATPAYSGQRDP